jgi:TolA-binding protein
MKYLLTVIVLILLVSCGTKKSAEELLTEGNTFLEEGKIPEAIDAYQQIIDNHNNSELAPDALSRLAAIYQNKLVKNIPEKESLQKAVELFYQIYEDYPESNFAPMGLFMKGFIEANELQNYDDATNTYNLFLQRYPDNELAPSAQEELDNMGLTPEEILQKNLTKEN